MSTSAARQSAGNSHALRALITSAAVVYGLHVGAELQLLQTARHPLVEGALLVALIVLPFLHRAVMRRVPWRTSRPALAAGNALAIQVAPALALAIGAGGDLGRVAAVVAVSLQGHLLVAFKDTRAAACALALAPLSVLVQLALDPDGLWLIALFASVVTTATGAFFLQRRTSWREASRTPAVVDSAREFEAVPQASGARLALHAIALATLVAALVPIAYLPLAYLPEPRIGGDATAPNEALDELEPEPRADTGSNAARADARDAFDQIFPASMGLSGDVSSLEHELVMEITPRARQSRGPLYLRGMVLDTIHDNGVSTLGRTHVASVDDAADGASDGWTHPNGADMGDVTYELDILQQSLRVRGGDWSVVFAPRPLVAARVPLVEHDRHGVTLTPVHDDWFEYSLRCAPRPMPSTRIDASAPTRYVQLPASSPELARIERLARDVTNGAHDDGERVQLVLDYFQRNFEYSVQSTGFPGLRGVVEFLDRREGHCSYYAAASTLMLRAVGIPARIATGFLASEWDDANARYVVTTRNAHAWIEVPFERVGWVALDATPARAREAAFAALDGTAETGLAALASELWGDLVAWAETGEGAFMRRFASDLLELPRALWVTVANAPVWSVAIAAALVIAVVVRRRARRAGERERVRRVPRRRDSGTDLFARVVDAVARIGPPRGPAQTLREYAADAGRQDVCAEFPDWAERYYRVRYGGGTWTENELEGLALYLRELRDARRASAG